jgi:hypothetical protein
MTLLGSKSDVDDICSLGFGGHLWFRLRCMTSSGGNNDDSSSDYQAKPGYGEFPSLPPEGYGVSPSETQSSPEVPGYTTPNEQYPGYPPPSYNPTGNTPQPDGIGEPNPYLPPQNFGPPNQYQPNQYQQPGQYGQAQCGQPQYGMRTVNRTNSLVDTSRRCSQSAPMVSQLRRWWYRLQAVVSTVSAESSESFWELSRSIRSSRQVKRDAGLR